MRHANDNPTARSDLLAQADWARRIALELAVHQDPATERLFEFARELEARAEALALAQWARWPASTLSISACTAATYCKLRAELWITRAHCPSRFEPWSPRQRSTESLPDDNTMTAEDHAGAADHSTRSELLDKADHARRLALEMGVRGDPAAVDRLLDYARELEASAAALERGQGHAGTGASDRR
jgi:hypothetical protein